MSPQRRAGRRTAAIAMVTCLLASLGWTTPAAAQWGAAAGVRSVAGPRDGNRNGIELRGVYDRDLHPRLTLRGELAYTQMRTPAVDAAGRYKVNENGFELALAARVPFRVALAEAYLLTGPVAAFRAACGVDSHFDPNGRVPCAGDATSRLGIQTGIGLRGLGGDGLDWMAEVRLMRGTVAAAGGSLVAIGVGLQRR